MIHQIIHPRAKRLSLRVDQKAGVIRLTIPPRANDRSINRFLDIHKEWIAERQKSLKPKMTIDHGAIIPFKGVDYMIAIQPHSKRATNITISELPDDNTIHPPMVDGRQHPTITIQTSRADPTSNFKRWLIDQARESITFLAHEKAAAIGKKIDKIDLRDTGSRWGSCSTANRLMFSWRLIMAPHFVLDYVVAHEVAHLNHMDHSAKFWTVCYSLTNGDADAARLWLKQQGNDLMRWF